MELLGLSGRNQGGQWRRHVHRPHIQLLDIYIERDSKAGVIDEAGLRNSGMLVQKLRIVRFLRTPDYDALYSGDPYWATECVGGMDLDGRTLVTKSSYRMLHTLTNLSPPRPNITVLWSSHMPAHSSATAPRSAAIRPPFSTRTTI